MKNINNTYLFYKTPIDFLIMSLDEKGFVFAASFEVKNGEALEVSGKIKESLDDYFSGKDVSLNHLVSSEVHGTPFQKEVWKSISLISFGKTGTYKELAKDIGNENAARAFGTACGKNPVALFIPCHRVVRSSGEDFGYSWGKERKEWLLRHEGGFPLHS